MKKAPDESSLIAQSILPLLRTFTSSGIAILGCHSTRTSHPSCEYDLLIIGKEVLAYRTLKIGDTYLDILFRDPNELTKADPEFLVSLATLVPLRDTALLLGSAKTAAKKGFQTNSRAAAANKLTSALKSIGRAKEALGRGAVADADFWLLSAGYDYSSACLYSKAVVPSPSHVLDQMKRLPRSPTRFRDWSDAVALGLASRASSENRLEGLSVVYDFMRSVDPDSDMLHVLARYRSPESFELVKQKTSYLLASMRSVDAFAYLGLEVVRTLLDLTEYRAYELKMEPEPSKTIEFLTIGKDRLIAQDVIRLLGLVRSNQLIDLAADKVQDSIGVMAKLM